MVKESGSNVTEYDYTGRGRVEKKTFENGNHTDYGYDGLRRLTSINNMDGGTNLLAQTFAWDAMSNKTQRVVGSTTHNYTYDNLYRLKPFTYDDVGNRTDTGYSPGASGSETEEMNEYASTPLGAMTYDLNGNLTLVDNANNAVMAYDYRNQMVSYSDGTADSYRYDALGRWIE